MPASSSSGDFYAPGSVITTAAGTTGAWHYTLTGGGGGTMSVPVHYATHTAPEPVPILEAKPEVPQLTPLKKLNKNVWGLTRHTQSRIKDYLKEARKPEKKPQKIEELSAELEVLTGYTYEGMEKLKQEIERRDMYEKLLKAKEDLESDEKEKAYKEELISKAYFTPSHLTVSDALEANPHLTKMLKFGVSGPLYGA